jgi:hypothetical protein
MNEKKDDKKTITRSGWISYLHNSRYFVMNDYYQGTISNFTKFICFLTFFNLIIISYSVIKESTFKNLIYWIIYIEIFIAFIFGLFFWLTLKNRRNNQIKDFNILSNYMIENILSGKWTDIQEIHSKYELFKRIMNDKYENKKFPNMQIKELLLDDDNYNKEIQIMDSQQIIQNNKN